MKETEPSGVGEQMMGDNEKRNNSAAWRTVDTNTTEEGTTGDSSSYNRVKTQWSATRQDEFSFPSVKSLIFELFLSYGILKQFWRSVCVLWPTEFRDHVFIHRWDMRRSNSGSGQIRLQVTLYADDCFVYIHQLYVIHFPSFLFFFFFWNVLPFIRLPGISQTLLSQIMMLALR